MHNTWFVGDTHFGHKNILEYERYHRPFETLEEMHEVMIDRWNKVVKPNDKVYHLGDFCFGRVNIGIAARLNGKKTLIMGNHDVYGAGLYLNYFDHLCGALFWKKCLLTHIPVHINQLGSRCFLNVHGHLHSKRVQHCLNGRDEDDPNYFNVSCEQNNLTPIHADVILQRVQAVIE